MSQATREDIERVLKSLLTEIAPRDDKLHNDERTINQTMLKRLRFRKNLLGAKWFKDPIREAFGCNIVQNLVVRVKRGPEATLETQHF